MRGSIATAGAAGLVAALLLLGGWFLFADPEPTAAGTGSPAPTITLEWTADASGSRAPHPPPTVPPTQVRVEEEGLAPTLRTRDGGRQLLVRIYDLECVREEVGLLAEHPDRVEVEIRGIAKPPPPSVSVAPDGSYFCGSISYAEGPYALIGLRSPLGPRTVVIHRESG